MAGTALYPEVLIYNNIWLHKHCLYYKTSSSCISEGTVEFVVSKAQTLVSSTCTCQLGTLYFMILVSYTSLEQV